MQLPKGDIGLAHELGFAIVRRGYDRDQVHAYVARLAGAEPPTEPPAFDLVRRGYDCDQVDAHIAATRATPPRQD
ncbi:hypothetical protein [Streptomyces sp. Je 1-332]|uniref:hypothetical protein n=1 Tax=Streptomyces sp. Je 1-332 TaxID=3231270 RepID=UPI003457BA6C